jgi:hypothetical protein
MQSRHILGSKMMGGRRVGHMPPVISDLQPWKYVLLLNGFRKFDRMDESLAGGIIY